MARIIPDASEKNIPVHGEENSKKGFAASVKEAYGYDCTVVEDVSEFNLDSDTLLSIEDTKDKVATQQQLTDVRNQLSKIHDELEAILYNADLAVGNGATQDKINEINNIILELDKSSLRLGSAVSKECGIEERVSKMKNTIVIGIAGGTGSGKTTLINRIKKEFNDEITILSHDFYYKENSHLPFEERGKNSIMTIRIPSRPA